jgi:hypothetical protein
LFAVYPNRAGGYGDPPLHSQPMALLSASFSDTCLGCISCNPVHSARLSSPHTTGICSTLFSLLAFTAYNPAMTVLAASAGVINGFLPVAMQLRKWSISGE